MSIQLGIGADVSGALPPIKELVAQLKDLKTQIKTVGAGTPEFDRLSSAIINTKNQIQQSNASMNAFATSTFGVSRATRIAHNDLDQMSRSVALFASGNERGVDTLSQLVFTFERLKGATGSGKAAIGALLGSLTGPAGLLLAFSTAVNLATIFGEKLFGTSEAEKEAAKQAEELKKKLAELIQPIDEIKESATGGLSGEISKVQALASIVEDQTKSYKERNNALLELHGINKDYFADQSLESTNLTQLKTKVEEYTKALVAQGVVKAFVEDISKVGKELAIQQGALEKIQGVLNKFSKGVDETGAPIINLKDQTGSASAVIATFTDKLNKQLPIVSQLKDQYGELNKALQTAIEESLKHPLDLHTSDAVKGLTEVQRKLIAVAEQAQEFFKIPLNLKFSVDDTDKTKLQKAIDIIKGIKDQSIRLNIIAPEDIKIPKVKLEIDKPEFNKSIDDLLARKIAPIKLALNITTIGEQLTKLQVQLQDSFKIDPKNILDSLQKAHDFILTTQEQLDTIKLATKLDIDPTELAKQINNIKNFIPKNQTAELDLALAIGDIKLIGLKQQLAAMNEKISAAINDSIKNINVEGLATIGEAIGTALSGGDIGNVFKKFTSFLGDAIESLGKQIIKLGIAASGLSKALKTLFANPVAAIAAGVALVAIGAAIKASVGTGLKGFAQGGSPPVGVPSVVGERGPELFVPNVAGKIIPNHQLKSFADNNFATTKNISSAINQNSFFNNSTITNLVKGLPHLQSGGITTSDTIAQLHKAEVIMPLDRLKGILGNQSIDSNVNVGGEFVLRGEDLALTLDRFSRRKGRSF